MFLKRGEIEMDERSVDLLTLSESQKTKFLEHARAYLKQRVEEERNYSSMSLSSLEKDDAGLKFNVALVSLKDTVDRLKNLKAEEKSLLLEIAELQKKVDEKATALESEVASLREEAESLRSLMGQE